MFIETLKSKVSGEVKWLKEWGDEEKKIELWNVIATLIEEMKYRGFDEKEIYFVFSRYSSGIVSCSPEIGVGKRKLIAVIKPWEFPKFRELCKDLEYSSYSEQEEAIDPIVESVFKQVYG